MIVKNFLGGSGGESANIYLTGLLSTDTVECTSPSGKSLSAVWGTYTVESVSTQCWRIVASEYGTYLCTAERTGTFEKEVSCLVDVATDYTIDMYSVLPVGYTEVDYISSTTNGYQYIDTNIYPRINYIFEITTSFNSFGNGQANYNYVYGSNDYSVHGFILGVYQSTGKIFAQCGSSAMSTSLVLTTNTKYTLELDCKSGANKAYVDSEVVGTNTWSNTAVCEQTMIIFASHGGSAIGQYADAKVYEAKVTTQDGTLIQHMIPCLNTTTNKYGMYDIVSNTFFGNSGSGDFTGGNE